jgi:hypothetical protein
METNVVYFNLTGDSDNLQHYMYLMRMGLPLSWSIFRDFFAVSSAW